MAVAYSQYAQVELKPHGPSCLIWRLHPNGGRMAAVSIPRSDAVRVCDRGWLRIMGRRAVIGEVLDWEANDRVALRIVFDEPFPQRHP